MPGFNGTGPEGKGPRTGRGEGNCGKNDKSDNIKDIEEKEGEILGVGRGGRPRGGGRGHCYGGGRRRRGLSNRGGRQDQQLLEDDK